MKMKKGNVRKEHFSEDQSRAVYRRRGPTSPRTLGSTANHDHPIIPSSTFRTLDQTIPASSLRTVDCYDYNPRTGKSTVTKKPLDVMDHARSHINKARFHTVTSGQSQRYLKAEEIPDQTDHHMMMMGSGCSPLGGGRGKKRKERY